MGEYSRMEAPILYPTRNETWCDRAEWGFLDNARRCPVCSKTPGNGSAQAVEPPSCEGALPSLPFVQAIQAPQGVVRQGQIAISAGKIRPSAGVIAHSLKEGRAIGAR